MNKYIKRMILAFIFAIILEVLFALLQLYLLLSLGGMIFAAYVILSRIINYKELYALAKDKEIFKISNVICIAGFVLLLIALIYVKIQYIRIIYFY